MKLDINRKFFSQALSEVMYLLIKRGHVACGKQTPNRNFVFGGLHMPELFRGSLSGYLWAIGFAGNSFPWSPSFSKTTKNMQIRYSTFSTQMFWSLTCTLQLG